MTIDIVMLKHLPFVVCKPDREKRFDSLQNRALIWSHQKRGIWSRGENNRLINEGWTCGWVSIASASSVKIFLLCPRINWISSNYSICRKKIQAVFVQITFCYTILEASPNLQIGIFFRRFIWFDSSIGLKITDSSNHEFLNLKG